MLDQDFSLLLFFASHVRTIFFGSLMPFSPDERSVTLFLALASVTATCKKCKLVEFREPTSCPSLTCRKHGRNALNVAPVNTLKTRDLVGFKVLMGLITYASYQPVNYTRHPLLLFAQRLSAL
eukprot:Phypoly_transcript_21044.p1 GENE.Phypoly_transcript_21044~~Phypoly_transcript_21044.p1  ORF type:complete len:123 (-),score=1.27 Phypoly_transcript_21044:12-380(-)